MSMAVHTCQSIILIVIDLKIPGEHVLSCAESCLKVFLHWSSLSFLKYNITFSPALRNRVMSNFCNIYNNLCNCFPQALFYKIYLRKELPPADHTDGHLTNPSS